MRLTFADGAVMDSVVCTSKTGTYVICTTVDVTGIHASGACTLSISVDNPQYVDPSHEFFSAATTPYYVHGEPRRARFASTRVTCACADLWFPSFGISPNGVVEPTITSTAPDTFEESSVTIDVGLQCTGRAGNDATSWHGAHFGSRAVYCIFACPERAVHSARADSKGAHDDSAAVMGSVTTVL
jgi:hypothetical protein